jgi:hypothetical protein
MRRHVSGKRLVVTALALAAAATAGAIAIAATRGEQPRAFSRPGSAVDALPIRAARFLKPGQSRRIATFVSATGTPRAVFLNRSKDDTQICVWDTDTESGAQSGGCNSAADFFAGHAFTLSLDYDGGPAIATVRDARIVGVVTDAVATLEVVYADGTAKQVAITRDRGFADAVPNALLRKGVGPVALIARDARGLAIDRQVTGIG